MRPAILFFLALVLSAPTHAQTIIQTGQASVYVSGQGSGRAAAIDPFGGLTVIYPPAFGGPYVYNPREGTLTGPSPQIVTIPGAMAGGPLLDPVYVMGF